MNLKGVMKRMVLKREVIERMNIKGGNEKNELKDGN